MGRFLVAVLAVVVLAAGCSSDDEGASGSSTSTSVASGPEAPSDLMVQNAASATFEARDDGGYQLTLGGVDDRVIWFTDRPARQVGTETNADLIDAFFDESSPEGPPNAAMVWEKDGDEQVLVVTLESGEIDTDTGDVIYTVSLLDTSSGKLAEFDSNADVPGSPVGPVSLFIDNLFRHQQCITTVFNELTENLNLENGASEPPGHFAPDPVNAGESATWSFSATYTFGSCSGLLTYNPAGGGLFSYFFVNYNVRASIHEIEDCDGITCALVEISDNYILNYQVIICESSLSEQECIAKTQ